MERVVEKHDRVYVTKKIPYKKIKEFPDRILNKCFNFAYNMTYGESGQHRSYRSGGINRRKNGEIFINTFQGKLAEYGIWNEFKNRNFEIGSPDLSEDMLGKWDEFDFIYNGYKISVKSTKFYGNLLLLEKKDWTEKGIYIPDKAKETSYYDFFVLLRISPNGENIMKNNKILYSQKIDKEELKKYNATKL